MNCVYLDFISFNTMFRQQYYKHKQLTKLVMAKGKSDLFTPEELDQIRTSLQKRNQIEQPLSKHLFSDEKSHQQNVKQLCELISELLKLDSSLNQRFMHEFREYIECEYNIPIQVNFMPLKYEQLVSLFQEWSGLVHQTSYLKAQDRLYTINHRNILFNRVFVEQQENIKDYFQTLSDKSMLKPVDLYQLLVNILSPYFFYEFQSDNQVFFDKVNSFKNFLQIVEKFKHSSERIIIDNKSQDFDYIKLYQFQALLHFWEKTNTELQLRSEKRYSMRNQQIQTESSLGKQFTVSVEIQTIVQKQKQLNLTQTINQTLRNLNKITETQEDPDKLETIQNICEMLRKQKIKLCQNQKGNKLNQSGKGSKNLIRQSPTRNITEYPKIQVSAPGSNSLGNLVSSPEEQSQFQVVLPRQQTNLQSQQSQKTKRQVLNFRKQSLDLQDSFEIRSKKLYNQISGGFKPSHLRKKSNSNKLKTEQSFGRREEDSQGYQEAVLSFQKSSPHQNLSNNKYKNRFNQVNNHVHTNDSLYGQDDLQNYQNPYSYTEYDIVHQNKQPKVKNQYFFKANRQDYARENNQMVQLLEIIYSNYSSQTGFLNIDGLNTFFIEIGIIQPNETSLAFNLIKKQLIDNLKKIEKYQFFTIMDMIMKQDQELTFEVISEFVDTYIVKEQAARQHYNIMPRRSRSRQRRSQQKKYRYNYNNSVSYNNTSAQKKKVTIPMLNIGGSRRQVQQNSDGYRYYKS